MQIRNNKKYLQKNCEVLIENKLDNQERYFGRTKHMTPVIFESNNCKVGELVNIKITSLIKKVYLAFMKIIKLSSIIFVKINKQNQNQNEGNCNNSWRREFNKFVYLIIKF